MINNNVFIYIHIQYCWVLARMSLEDHLEQFNSHLNLIKSMTGDKAQQEFYQLMQKAKVTFGQLSLTMAQYYFQYAKFLLEKMQKNIDIFNANSLPVAQQEQQDEIIEDPDQDDSSLENNSASVRSEGDQHKVSDQSNKNNQPIITQNVEQKKTVQSNKVEGQADNGGQEDDFQICADNLLCAIKIFENQKQRLKDGGEQERYSKSEISRWISRCKSRLGDLYQLSQNYQQAIAVYFEVVNEQQQKIGAESNRGLAQINYMIANSYLYENKQNCEKLAIQQFIKSVKILLNRLNQLSVYPQQYQVPTEEKVKVNRFPYLPNTGDEAEVKDIKQVISLLLDKIQDTHEQISIRGQYEELKKKTKQQEKTYQFKQVAPSVKVISLGKFGRKKKPQQLPEEELKKRGQNNEKKEEGEK